MRDLINTERAAHAHSVVLVHDCFPFNTRMADRVRRYGDETEEEGTRDFWTGDVWKLVPTLKKYRPDLSVFCLDCPPTGLLMLSNLDASSTVLSENYDLILEEFLQRPLDMNSIRELWTAFPILDTERLVAQAGSVQTVINAKGDAATLAPSLAAE